MSVTFQCGDQGALVAYLYDEYQPGEQETIASHIEGCPTCASEIGALSATRRTLAAWTPPDLALGFQITRQDIGPAKVLERKVPWWSAPMPAWAQAAAALLIFGAGLGIGVARTDGRSGQVARDTVVAPTVESVTPVVSRDDLAQVEARLKAELAQMRTPTASATPVSRVANDGLDMQQIKALIDQSEERQRREFTLRMVDLAGNIETQRRVDLATVRQSMGQQQGVIGTELRQQREVIDRFNNYLVNVSERSR